MGAVLNLKLTPVSGSVSIPDNTSRVHILLTITTDAGTYNETGSTDGSLTLNGTQIASLRGKKVYYNTVTTLYDATHTVQHQADGSGSAAVKASFDVETSVRWIYAQQTAELPQIPRAATMTVPPLTLGRPGTLRVDCAEGLTYTVDYVLGESRGRAVEKSSAATALWTPPLSLARAFPDTAEGSGTLTLTTWSGETAVGSCDYPFTVAAGEELAPQVTAVAVGIISDGSVPAAWGVAVKGKSRLSYTVTAAAKEGASVTACRFTCGAASGTGLTGTTAWLTQTGTFTPRAVITDSRGKTAVWECSAVTVYDYAPPTLTDSRVFRADAQGSPDGSGTCLAVRASAAFSSVGGRNSVTLRERHRAVGGSWSRYTALTAGAATVISGFALASSYEVEISAVDALGECRTVVCLVSTEEVTLHLREGGRGIGFGKYAEREGWVESAWPLDMTGHALTGLAAPSDDDDAVPLGHLEERLTAAAQQTEQRVQGMTAQLTTVEQQLSAAQQALSDTTDRLSAAEQQLSAAQQALSDTTERLSAAEQQISAFPMPEMVPGQEYLTAEKWNGAAVYTRAVDYGALPNSAEGENYTLPAGLNIIAMSGFAVGPSYIIPIPGYYAINNMGYTKSSGNLWISTTRDLSAYHGYLTVKYTK